MSFASEASSSFAFAPPRAVHIENTIGAMKWMLLCALPLFACKPSGESTTPDTTLTMRDCSEEGSLQSADGGAKLSMSFENKRAETVKA